MNVIRSAGGGGNRDNYKHLSGKTWLLDYEAVIVFKPRSSFKTVFVMLVAIIVILRSISQENSSFRVALAFLPNHIDTSIEQHIHGIKSVYSFLIAQPKQSKTIHW